MAGTATADPLPHVACPGHPRCLALIGQTQVQLPSLTGPWIVDLPDLPPPDDPEAVLELWDRAPAFWSAHGLVGVTRMETTMYSGGGAHIQWLFLLRSGENRLDLALGLPIMGSKTIRACFSEADVIARNDACADLYDFDASLTALPDTGTPPDLHYETRATVFPPDARLDHDNSHLPVPQDAAPAIDPDCTFTRIFRWDDASRSYRPDAPLPDCDTFTRL